MISNTQLVDLQSQIFEQSGIRTDVYYVEGRGALVVQEGRPLLPHNIILRIPEVSL
jgi:hypothetical protein